MSGLFEIHRQVGFASIRIINERAEDESTGEVALKEVVRVFENETDELVHVFAGGEEIVSTPGHKFYSPVKGWTSAVDLRAGDILVDVNGELVIVEFVQHEILEIPVKVYNFQVADDHTYYVGDTGVLVHNTCVRETADQKALRDLAKEARKSANKGKPISFEEAQILDEWAREYGVPQHHPSVIGSGAHFPGGGYQDHTHIFNIHAPFK